MRNISIVAIYVFVTRQYLRTRIFNLLKDNPDNFITIYTPAKRLAAEFNSSNVKVRSSKFSFGLKKSDLIILPEWHTEESKEILKKSIRWRIPTFFMQEGAGNPSGGYGTDIYPTRICVWGEIAKQLYVKKGIDPKRIVITGQPRFDLYHNLEKKRLFNADKKILLFLSQTLWRSPNIYPDGKEIIERHYDIIYEASRELGLQLVCKLHPSDNPSLYKREGVIVLEDPAVSPKNYIRQYNNLSYDPSISDMKTVGEIFFSCDVAVTFFSTAGLETMMLGRPTIFFDMVGCHKRIQITKTFIENCGFSLVTNKGEFIGLLDRYLKDSNVDSQKREKVIFDFAYKQDGKASERVVEAIEELLRGYGLS